MFEGCGYPTDGVIVVGPLPIRGNSPKLFFRFHYHNMGVEEGKKCTSDTPKQTKSYWVSYCENQRELAEPSPGLQRLSTGGSSSTM